jgi:hypothetical protein
VSDAVWRPSQFAPSQRGYSVWTFIEPVKLLSALSETGMCVVVF